MIKFAFFLLQESIQLGIITLSGIQTPTAIAFA